MSRLSLLLLVAVYSVALRNVYAESEADKDIHEAMIPIITECSKELGANAEHMIASKTDKDLEAVDGCLVECVFKKIGITDDDGIFVVEKFAEHMKKFLKKEGDTDKIEEIGKKCASVSEKSSDDKCAKSKLLLACLMEQKEALGL